MVVQFKNNLGTGQHQLSAIRPHDLALLSDRPFHEQSTKNRAAGIIRGRSKFRFRWILLLQPCKRMVRYFAALHGSGVDLDGPYPARLSEPCRDYGLIPRIKRDGRHRPVRRFDDQIRRAAKHVCEIPLRFIRPLLRRRHIFRIAFRRAGIDPFHDGLDLCVGQGPVILEFLNADGLVDVPGRHLPCDHALANGLSPWACFFIRHQRHWSH